MICRKCGKEIQGNRLFCPVCGTEVQMVPEYERVDDELQKSISRLKEEAWQTGNVARINREDEIPGTQSLKIPSSLHAKEESVQRKQREGTGRKEAETDRDRKESVKPGSCTEDKKGSSSSKVEMEDEDGWEEFSLEKKVTAKQKKNRLIAGIAALSAGIVLLVACLVCFLVFSVGQNSYQKQMEQAEKDWKSGNYESAITAFENAVSESDGAAERTKALCRLANLYVEYGDENSAIYYYEEAADLKLLTNEDVSTLVNLYENKADITAIRKLAEMYSNEETEALFEKHLLNQPIFNYKSGTYNELLTVEITAANNETIYYTLDNTEATPQSTPYTGVLQIGEGRTVVRAVAVNTNGLISDEIITTYEVQLDVPAAPIISPDTGSYSDASKVSIHNIPTNCKVYYTIDGTTPTAESMEYTEPFDMMLGNSVVMAVCINSYTGQSSPVAMKIYDLSVGGKISYAEAPGRVMNRLQETGEVLDGNGTMADGSVCNLLPATVTKVGNNSYYIVKRYLSTGGGLKEQGTAYAVDINTGAVYKAEDNGNGEYNLSGL